ncbi:MAG: mannose-1-phosphate guanylyltransferase [Bacteroidales bacterium]|nr:mannose-1-phosphate guanylyltransferase [Bacteroidales bacterium]
MIEEAAYSNAHLWVVIMAGGNGSRFWPMSNPDSPKQFLDVLGVGKTLLEMTFDRMTRVCQRDHVVIVTGENYVDRVRALLPDLQPYQVLGEPMRRNTAPCIAYAASIIGAIDPDAVLIVTPSDHAIFRTARFVSDLQQAVTVASAHDWIVTLGARPVRPDTSYGYIQFKEESSLPGADDLHPVITFTEKPPVDLARQFIATGEFFWNAGIFVWSLKVLKEAYEKYLPNVVRDMFALNTSTPHDELERVYSQTEAISVDNGIMEKASNVHVMAASFDWSDIETWDTLYDVLPRDLQGNAVLGKAGVFLYDTTNTIVSTPDALGKTVVVEGLDGYIVAANNDTIMVCRRTSEEQIFRFVSDVDLKKMMENK